MRISDWSSDVCSSDLISTSLCMIEPTQKLKTAVHFIIPRHTILLKLFTGPTVDFFLEQNKLWILLIALIAGGMLLWPSLSKGRPCGRIDLNDAIQHVNREPRLFADIRPADDFKDGSITQPRKVTVDEIRRASCKA